jgi:molybdate/tungstate transport system substrate-binding protein
MTTRARTRKLAAGFALLVAASCERPGTASRGESASVAPESVKAGGAPISAVRTREGTLVVFNAGSLALPIRAAFDSFAVGRAITLEQESAGSLETARKLTELGKTPDVIALADIEIFPRLLVPEHIAWYVPFARNRMVLAYRMKSRYSDEISEANWWRVLERPDINVGRSDPNQDPNGYRTLLVLRLLERKLQQPGLASRLLNQWGERYVRPKEADLVALLQAGELDYMWSYESMARAAGLRFVRLGSSVDLGNPEDSLFYETESVRVRGRGPADSITFVGAPILYALSIPRRAPHPELAAEFVRYLVAGRGAAVLRRAQLEVIGAGSRPIGDPVGWPLDQSGRP